jgi:hypothetical protein
MMNLERYVLGFGVAALVMTGCGEDSGKCAPPSLVGTLAGAMGTAQVSGKGTLPDGIPDGFQLQVLVSTETASTGSLPDNLLGENDLVCGKTFQYEVKGIEAGTYHLSIAAFDPASDSFDPAVEGDSPDMFTLVDGQKATLDTTFTLTAK